MKAIRMLVVAITVGFVYPAVAIGQDDKHDGHHPAAGAPATTPAPTSTPAPTVKSSQPTRPGAEGMDAQMKAMGEMHARMMAAKSPAERKALMAEHMKLMQKGMAMMGGMPKGGSATTGCDMDARHQQMQDRMDMMQSMMQMMLDRMPAAPAD